MDGGADGFPSAGPHTLWSEDNLAERVRLEREARGWSTGALAERMTKAGYPMNQSAIWRIESGTPRRRINLDEGIGFAEVFATSLEDLLSPPQLAMHSRVKELIQEVRQAFDDYLDRHPEVREEAEGAINQAMADDAIAGHYGGPVIVTLEADDADEHLTPESDT
jgi:transcriptional regulator with XRE-family HTH domain